MEPAVVTMRLSPLAVAAVDEVLASANVGPNPTIAAAVAGGTGSFTCDTYQPMLMARLADAFEHVLGPGWWQHADRVV